MKKVLIIAINCLLLSASVAFAQGPPPPPPPTPTGGGGGTAAPIDNEVILLLIGAAAFGAYKLRKAKLVLR